MHGHELVHRLRDELNRRRRLPGWVLFSPSADPFVPNAHDLRGPALELMAALMGLGIGITVQTRGGMPQADGLLTLARRFPGLLRVELGFFSSDRALVETWEAGAARPMARLDLAQALVNIGAEVVGVVGPLIPFINDGEADLQKTLRLLASKGVRTIKPVFIEDGPGLVKQVEREVSRSRGRLLNGWFRMDDGPRAGVRRLPSDARQARFERLMQLAYPLGLQVLACRCSIDHAEEGASCLSGPETGTTHGQLDLFG